jgi:hypothetical protein
LRDLFLRGVYNETYEKLTDGGPKCSSESTFGFKYALNQILLVPELFIVYYGVSHIARHYESKRTHLIKNGRGLNPSFIEYLQGLICFTILGLQIYFKTFTRTMIFIFNPCHFTTFLFGLVSILPLSRFTDILFPFAIGGCFGAWVGIVWAENGELSYLEVVSYYVQHVFAAFLAPLLIYLGGRFSITD